MSATGLSPEESTLALSSGGFACTRDTACASGDEEGATAADTTLGGIGNSVESAESIKRSSGGAASPEIEESGSASLASVTVTSGGSVIAAGVKLKPPPAGLGTRVKAVGGNITDSVRKSSQGAAALLEEIDTCPESLSSVEAAIEGQ